MSVLYKSEMFACHVQAWKYPAAFRAALPEGLSASLLDWQLPLRDPTEAVAGSAQIQMLTMPRL
jgi:hypothetical protein